MTSVRSIRVCFLQAWNIKGNLKVVIADYLLYRHKKKRITAHLSDKYFCKVITKSSTYLKGKNFHGRNFRERKSQKLQILRKKFSRINFRRQISQNLFSRFKT